MKFASDNRRTCAVCSPPGGAGVGVAAAFAALGLLLGWLHTADAVPACPTEVSVRQPDGREVSIRLRGDEFLHWHEDARGFTVLKDPTSGAWVYAGLDADGKLEPGKAVVGRDDPSALGVPRRLLPAGIRQRAEALAAAARSTVTAAAGAASLRAPRTGTVKNLVVLVQFPDKLATRTKAEFEALFNAVGYTVDGAQGSVRDYYTETSYGTLLVESVVADWVTLDNGYAYYGGNDPFGNDQRPREMVQEALAKLEARGFDFSTLDADGDGWVDGLDIIHSGGGEEYSGNDPDYIWSHQWQMLSTVTYDGKSMLPYHTEPERRGWDSSPSTWGLTRIGVICHETGHFLGLPDLYDYGYDSEGAGAFCLMAGGSWNGNSGTSPAHMNGWCKKELGWVVPAVVDSEGVYTVPRIETSPTAYRLQGTFPDSEYFIVENRQGYGFDSALPGPNRGLLIWHVDETQPNNNDQTHYLVDLEEASGTQQLELNVNAGDDADYFRAGNNTAFSSTTTPNNRSYSGVALGLDIIGVSATGTGMTFTVGALPLDHFDWSTIGTPQTANQLFDTTISARNALGGLVSTFTGSVGLIGLKETASSTVTIGSGTGTWLGPMGTYYHDMRTQVIYLNGDIGAIRHITGLALDVATVPGQTLGNWTIRMKHTTLSSYGGSPVWETGWTTCYQADESVTQTGWRVFTFTTPFDYNGTDNLMVDFSFNNSSFTTDGLCRYTSTSPSRRCIYYRTDSGAGDPLGWPANGFNPSPTRSAYLPNVRLIERLDAPISVTPTTSGPFGAGVWSGKMAVLEAATSVRLVADDGAGHRGESNPFEVLAAPVAVTLDVVSDYGMAWPPAGHYDYLSGTNLTCSVTNARVTLTDAYGSVTAACTGWSGTGSVTPPAGTGTSVSFTLNENSVLTWQWVVTDLVLSNRTVTAITNYTARDTITAGNGFSVEQTGAVTFSAGDVIRLTPGFAARSGSVFRARTP